MLAALTVDNFVALLRKFEAQKNISALTAKFNASWNFGKSALRGQQKTIG
eukprot:TRINITY_DN1412_c0_g1_i1.p2 TRINITY_DN1412_c0_g1~~TRINITY_DN1412_c0_g1_i1.p2  ORF type:complete len:50 (-),score=1.63 TRINITY_DN1412_c0_g1_i1:111-260(-)